MASRWWSRTLAPWVAFSLRVAKGSSCCLPSFVSGLHSGSFEWDLEAGHPKSGQPWRVGSGAEGGDSNIRVPPALGIDWRPVEILQLAARTKAHLEEGRRLFNDQRFFEAHEVWEGAWRAEKDATRALLQGLIQVAAGYFKALSEENAAGAVKLLEMGLEKLAPFPEVCAGLSLGALRIQVTSDLGEVRGWLETDGAVPFRKGPVLEVFRLE